MFQVGDMVRMAPYGGSYIREMRETFARNPIVEVIKKNARPNHNTEYYIKDFNGCCWCVMEKEILCLVKPQSAILFL